MVARIRLQTFSVLSTEPDMAKEWSEDIARQVIGPLCPTKLSAKSQISRFQDFNRPSALPETKHIEEELADLKQKH